MTRLLLVGALLLAASCSYAGYESKLQQDDRDFEDDIEALRTKRQAPGPEDREQYYAEAERRRLEALRKQDMLERDARRRQQEEEYQRRQAQASRASGPPQTASRSYFDSRRSSTAAPSDGVDEQRPSRWERPWRVQTSGSTSAPPSGSEQEQDNSFRRTVHRRQNTTLTRTRGSGPTEITRSETSTRTELFSRNNQSSVEDIFGPVRVTDTELHGGGSAASGSRAVITDRTFDRTADRGASGGGGGGGYSFRRYNVTSAVGTRTSSSSSSSSAGGLTRVQGPTLWSNRTWHWSTNRTRPEYDPDLDGTTTPRPSYLDYDDVYVHPWAVKRDERCDPSTQGCHPEVGNLLVGRADRLEASSTCGRERPEGYCLISDLAYRKKCYTCQQSLPPVARGNRTSIEEAMYTYHGIENIIQGERDNWWWQASPSEQRVSITLNLEAEFHFTHLWIEFKTYRPAAMLIERSQDQGKSWSTYQYFAQDCPQAFPGIPSTERRYLTDVVCTSDYTKVDKSTGGEVVFKVLPSTVYSQIRDPYHIDVQNLLKVTNLRINFTKLQTLGDNLLDSGDNIKEKYFYAISKMTVRGYCSCYGHAARCLPAPGQAMVANMVYGICECVHHTTGTNCEKCEDLYNDREWRPGQGSEPNPCQRCECHGHASKCRYDPAVFEASGRASGGVCEECTENTSGKNCEQCMTNFYRESYRPLTDPCTQCNCEPAGSLDEGICDPSDEPLTGALAGQCHCKTNVEGRRCDTCKQGFWNFRLDNPDGCQECSCNRFGTIDNKGCNVKSGECLCKRNVMGRDCNACAPMFYGLSGEEEGCKACDCDEGGAFDNNCDLTTGQCRCRPHVAGRRCDSPENAFFAPYIDYVTHEGELSRGSADTQVTARQPYPNSERSWSGSGFMRAYDRSTLEFDITDVPETLDYDVHVRYEPQSRDGRPQKARVSLERLTGAAEAAGPCRGKSDAPKSVVLGANERQTAAVPGGFCLERGKPYRIKIELDSDFEANRETPSSLIDSIVLIPQVEELPFYQGNVNQRHELARCAAATTSVMKPPLPDVCRRHLFSAGFFVFNGAHSCDCEPTGSSSSICEPLGGQCKCKANVVGRRCDKCAPGFFNFGPDGCKACDCHNVGSRDNFCDVESGQCRCRDNTYGRQCDECQPGFWNYPNCARCDCNGHSDTCDSKSGACIGCRDHTGGDRCEACERGFYGNALLGYDIPCRPCPCPGTPGSGISHADTCDLDPRTQAPICRCLPGYTGERCDRCSEDFFGNPASIGGSCTPCDCSGNTDMGALGNCDSRSGQCLRCLYNSKGDHCELCKDGWWGDATKQQCAECVCNILGTRRGSNGTTDDDESGRALVVTCDNFSGQCPCLPNVVGKQCDQCAPNHWKLASGEGCSDCDCDKTGSRNVKCDEYDGQCHCMAGRGGRQCNQCMANHWGNPRMDKDCKRCDCVMSGSATSQCDRDNGSCVCLPGISGYRCDQCARGYIGRAPHCEACGECFDNWDYVIQKLKDETKRLIDLARRIKSTGTTGAYKEEFTLIENNLAAIQQIIEGAAVTQGDIDAIDDLAQGLRSELLALQAALQALEERMEETNTRTTEANLSLNHLKAQVQALAAETMSIKENMTALQEANVEGAFNLTRDAQRRSADAAVRVRSTGGLVSQSAAKRSDTENMLNKFGNSYNQSFLHNEEGLNGLDQRIRELEANVPEINNYVCDGRGTIETCDALCGGAGCGKCGGISCDQGATTLAANALELGEKSREQLNLLQDKARKELEGILGAKSRADEALRKALLAYERSMSARNTSEDTTAALQLLLDDIDKFFDKDGSRPADIRTVAEQCLAMEMSLTPDQILDLARQINETMSGITNIDKILVATAGDLARANELKLLGDRAKQRADEILDTAKQVLDALERARDAQNKAQEAIRKATKDIDGAKSDLTLIAGESETASTLSAKAQEEIVRLQGRLDELKKKFTQNEYDVRKAAEEAALAGKLSKDASDGAGHLEKQFEKAKDALDKKAKDSGANKQRAERLRERAKALAEAASAKSRALQAIEDEFDENERKLKEYQRLVDELNAAMLGHLNEVERKAEIHRTCVP